MLPELRAILGALAVGVTWLSGGLCLAQALHLRARMRDAESDASLPAYAPRVTLVVPCKAVDLGFEDNALALLGQDYPDYEVVFVTASCDEPAHAHLARILASHPCRGRLAVAGPAVGRSQKVHNQLRALQLADPTSEVLAFVDSDGHPGERFLRHLVAPLADASVGASTGYRWFASAHRGFLGAAAATWGATIAWACADERFSQLWGGAMAIRRQHFEALGVAQAWAGASTDDDALTRLLRSAGRGVAFAPRCYVPSKAPRRFGAFMAWGTRQLLLMRVYLPDMWWKAFAMAAVSALAPTVGLALALAAPVSPGLLVWGSLLLAGGMAPTISSAVVARSTERLARAIGSPVRRLSWIELLACAPGAWLFVAHFIMSGRTRQMVWQGTTYRLLGPDHTVVLSTTADGPVSASAQGGRRQARRP